jgi:hypothetical protein
VQKESFRNNLEDSLLRADAVVSIGFVERTKIVRDSFTNQIRPWDLDGRRSIIIAQLRANGTCKWHREPCIVQWFRYRECRNSVASSSGPT